MYLGALNVTNLRCLETVEYEPAPGINLIWGANGSGKTSLLEAVALIGLGKSFLTNRATDLVRTGSVAMNVRARTVGEDGLASVVNLRKEGGETHITLDGISVLAASVLARHLPLMVLNSKAADLLTESPANRRALIDRTMFHVEQSYGEIWKQYRQVLRHRNQLVRTARREELGYWNQQLATLSVDIDTARRTVVKAINAKLSAGTYFLNLGELSFAYHPGWNESTPLVDQLDAAWPRDCQVGYTTLGSHRGDLALRANGRSVIRRLSRGQAKFVVSVVLVALAEFMRTETGCVPIMLIDDLAAELDDNNRYKIVDMICSLNTQALFTAINPTDLPLATEQAQSLFHVEQRQSQ